MIFKSFNLGKITRPSWVMGCSGIYTFIYDPTVARTNGISAGPRHIRKGGRLWRNPLNHIDRQYIAMDNHGHLMSFLLLLSFLLLFLFFDFILRFIFIFICYPILILFRPELLLKTFEAEVRMAAGAFSCFEKAYTEKSSSLLRWITNTLFLQTQSFQDLRPS